MQLAWLGVASHAPGYSAFNWEIESQWVQPRKKLRGMQLGCEGDPFKGVEKEEALRSMSERAVKEFASLVGTCTTAGKPWRVSTPLEHTHLTDAADIRACLLEFQRDGFEGGRTDEIGAPSPLTVGWTRH